MDVYLLIDTTNWKRLVSAIEIDRNLKALYALFQQRKIQIIVPPALTEEWKKHREQEIGKIRSALKKMTIKEGVTLTDEQEQAQRIKLETEQNILIKQVEWIDDIIENGLRIDESPEGVQIIYRHQTANPKLAPFHTDKDALNDARLIFHTLAWLQERKKENLFFLSHNHTQFGSPSNPETELHPQIIEPFKGIEVQYCTEAKSLMQLLEAAGVRPPRGEKIAKNYVTINRDASIHKQLMEFFSKKFGELSVLPVHLYANEYPFIVDRQLYHSRPGEIATDNLELLNYFKELPADLNETEQKERANLCKRLAWNHISQITHRSELTKEIKATITVEESGEPLCQCSTCQYRRLDFSILLNLPDEAETETGATLVMRKAYVLHKFGYTLRAVKLNKQLAENKDRYSNTLNYLVQFNLAVLGRSLYRINEEDIGTLNEELKAIDIDEQLDIYRVRENKPVIEWFHDFHFYREAQRKILIHNLKIRELYNSKSTGFDDTTSEMLVQFYWLGEAALQNGIIVDMSSIYDDVTNAYIEGLFASYACQPALGGKLIYFSTDIAERLLLEGNPDIIRKFAARYKVKKVTYQESGKPGSTWFDRLQNLFGQIDELHTKMEEHANAFVFWRNHERITLSAFTLLSLFETTSDQVERFTEMATEFLKKEKHLQHYKLQTSLIYFLNKKRNQLPASCLLKWFALLLIKPTLWSPEVFSTLFESFEIQKYKLKLSPEQFAILQNICEVPNEDFPDNEGWKIYAEVFQVLEDEDQKNHIASFMKDTLKQNFEEENFYYASILNVIKPDIDFLIPYTQEVLSIITQGQRKRFDMGQTFYSDHRVDAYLNLYLKYDIPIPDEILKLAPGLGPYYTWLLSPDTFNYSLFNKDWLSHYPTRYHRRYLRKSEVLKNQVAEMIKNDFENKELLQFYFFTYDIDGPA